MKATLACASTQTCAVQCEVDIAQAMMEVSATTVMAVDHTKFKESGAKASLRIPALSPEDSVVCEKRPGAVFDGLLDAQNFIEATRG